MNEEFRRLMLAVSLSILVLVVWDIFVEKPRRDAAKKAYIEQQKNAPKPVQVPGVSEKPTIVLDQDRGVVIGQSPRVNIISEKLHGSINLQGIRFDDITLAGYRQEADLDSPEVVLLSPSGTKEVYFAEFGWIAADSSIKTPDVNTVWQANSNELRPGIPLIMTWNSGELTFVKTIELDEHYMLTVSQKVLNNSGKPVSLAPYGLLNRSIEPYQEFIISHEGALGVFDQVLHEQSYEDLRDEPKHSFKNVSGWLAIADKYWLTAIIPSSEERINANFTFGKKQGKDRYQTDFVGQMRTIDPTQAVEFKSHFFVGAKKVGLLDSYAEELNIPLFDRSVDFGWLYFLTKPIFVALKFFNGFLGNFGLAILMLTVIIKLILFPVANKGYRSMSRMKKLQPEVTKIRDRYKDDKLKFQQEMMAFYKKEKINPMSGCLPILIQIPIFFALYKTLFITIEMRHAPFYGWIKDLSASDPTTIFNLFGLLPFDPPTFLMIGAWPVIMAASMIVQQQLNPPPPDPVQAKVIKALPFVFVFLFARFPAGLIIYWSWSNVLSILQQWVIARNLPDK